MRGGVLLSRTHDAPQVHRQHYVRRLIDHLLAVAHLDHDVIQPRGAGMAGKLALLTTDRAARYVCAGFTCRDGGQVEPPGGIAG